LILVQILAGVFLLSFCGDSLVKGSVLAGLRFNISPLIIGLTVVAFGTSAPELIVAIQASLSGLSGMALGNVVGSNIANVLLVLGLPILFFSLDIRSSSSITDYWIMFGATIFFILLLTNGAIFFWHGIILILLQISILIRSYILARSSKSNIKQEIIDDSESFEGPKWNKLLKIAGLILLGIFGLPLGAHFLINGAVGLAQFFNVSEEVIGLSIVAVGTSLPELATTFAAVRRNQGEVILGNIIGSNLFNILFIVGVASLIAPINFQQIDLVQSLGYLFVSVVFLLAIVIKPRIIGRNWGAVFLLSYASYLWFLVY
tara:strand:- start:1967 stop:2917 length:951 start_codon:yes stop_codon:yes gene_type:complete